MPFDKIRDEKLIVGDKAIMYAPWTPLAPKLVTIFGINDNYVRVVTEDDTMFKFPKDSLEYKTETGYVWELRKYDKAKFDAYTYKLEELVEVRRLKKELGEIIESIQSSWSHIQDLDRLRRVVTLLEIVKDEIEVLG